MDRIASALGDAARWRIVELLAERPRSVGELAELTGLRQPQTTKHLQTLARAGLVTVFPLGQRRVYALETAPLTALADRLRELVETAEAHAGERDVIARYRAAIEAESAVADRERWADGRTFAFERVLPAPPRRRLAALGRPGPARVLVGAAVDDGHRLRPRAAARAVAPSSTTGTPTARTAPKGGSTPPRNPSTSRSTSRCSTRPGRSRSPATTTSPSPRSRTARGCGSACASPRRPSRPSPTSPGIETGWGQVLDNLADTHSTTGKEPITMTNATGRRVTANLSPHPGRALQRPRRARGPGRDRPVRDHRRRAATTSPASGRRDDGAARPAQRRGVPGLLADGRRRRERRPARPRIREVAGRRGEGGPLDHPDRGAVGAHPAGERPRRGRRHRAQGHRRRATSSSTAARASSRRCSRRTWSTGCTS